MKLLLATSNLGKAAEFRGLLGSEFKIVLPNELNANSPGKLDVVEDGSTYYENALKKAVQFQKKYQVPVLSDDSGLEIDALKGGPGVQSARFGGAGITWTERWYALYDLLKRYPAEKWPARFRCVLCYHDAKIPPRFFEGVVEGWIMPEPKGNQGFGYDPIFYSSDLEKSFGEATAEEKARVSHRARAALAFRTAWPLDRK